MKVLFDILHPAHVHKFKNIIWELERRGHKAYVTARDKEVTLQLLEGYKIPFTYWKKKKDTIPGKIHEVSSRFINLCLYCKKIKPDVLIANGGFVIAPAGKFLGIPTITMSEEADFGIFTNMIYSLTDVICTSHTFSKNLGRKHVKFKGFVELSYLKNFKPDPSILKEMKLKRNEPFFIIRTVCWKAIHDYNQRGFDKDLLIKIINKLKKHGRIFISDEGEVVPRELQPYLIKIAPSKMHSALYYASLFIGDGQIMSVEAGLLGTPSLRFNSLVGTAHGKGKFKELNRLQIVYSTGSREQLMAKIGGLLNNPNSKKEAKKRAKEFMSKMDDVTILFCNLIEKAIKK